MRKLKKYDDTGITSPWKQNLGYTIGTIVHTSKAPLTHNSWPLYGRLVKTCMFPSFCSQTVRQPAFIGFAPVHPYLNIPMGQSTRTVFGDDACTI